MPARTAESDALPLNTNARSFTKPSPLMSPATIGVNGVPDEKRE
jgi:hypothetical protein